MIYNIALGNDSQKAVNTAMLVDVNDIIEGKAMIRVNGNVNEAIQNIPAAPLQSWTFDMLEYLDQAKENRTGITKYNQGMDSNSLNKMLDINTPVPMADGSYKILKDIVDGDIIVGCSGNPTKVKKAHIIHYPERAYDITFASGETICAGGEHLWTVITQYGKKQVMDTDSIYKYMESKKATLYIPTVGKVDFNGKQAIVSIKPTTIRLMRCLTVDADDGLFCVGKHFTVTHNTATGINIITQQANQRLELIARVFAETGISDLYRFLIKLNQLFINEATVIRLTNGPMKIDPTDMDGNFDLVVNAGMGAGAKQTNLQNLQLIQQIVTQLAGVGMAGPEQFYNLAKRMIEEVGFKNTDDFVLSPDKIPPKPQAEDKVSESVRSDLDSAPWQVRMQYWQKQGYQVTPDMFTEQAATDAIKTAVDAHAKADATRGNNVGAGAGIKIPAAGAGRPAGAGVPDVSQAGYDGYPEYSGGADGAGISGTQLAGPSSGLQSGYSGKS